MKVYVLVDDWGAVMGVASSEEKAREYGFCASHESGSGAALCTGYFIVKKVDADREDMCCGCNDD